MELLTKTGLAELMKVTERTINNWISDGLVPETKIPLRFKYEDVKNWCNKREVSHAKTN